MKCPDSILLDPYSVNHFPDDACFVITSEIELRSTIGSALYGLYTILYVLCMYILFTRKRDRHWAHCALITIIYIVATIVFGLRYAIYSTRSQAALLQFAALKEHRLLSLDLGDEWTLLKEPLLWMEPVVGVLTIIANYGAVTLRGTVISGLY
ncbi:hypothetical protein PM082_022104 [Marasmius tenuissimus]|nr:hypothetical protein PM082_022104 [Marasmius tenuissimus]